MSKIINAILSGGSGTRLWPLSRESQPKQFLQIFGRQKSFQHTALRNIELVDDFAIITNENQFNAAKIQIADVGLNSTKIIETVKEYRACNRSC